MESKQIRGRHVEKPERKPSVNMLTMSDIITGVNSILNPGKEPVNWFAPAADAVAAVHVKDGKASIDNACVLYGGDVTDKEVAGLKVVAYDGREGGIYAEGAATDVTVDGAYISLAGDGEGIGGPASGAAAKYGAKLTLHDAVITTTGRTKYSTAAEEGSVLKVYDSVIWSHGIPYGENIPASDALMSTPPPPLEIDGNTRTHCTMSNSQSFFYRSKIICDGWAALSTESSEGYRPFYVGIAILLVVVAVLVVLFIRDTPEEVGLFPDGADHAPKSEAGDEVQLSVGEVLKRKESWILICNFGAFQFVINACMGSMVVWFTTLVATNVDKIQAGEMAGMFEGMGGMAGAGVMVLFVGQAVKWLTVGVVIGIVMSFIFGVIDDKLGTPIACLILGITEFFPIIGLMSQAKAVADTGACNVPMLILWGFGVACMTGGVPTMHPASVSFMFGRREYQSANRVIMAIQLIPSAVAAMMMTILMQNGQGTLAYGILLAVVIFGIATTLPMLKMKDANAEGRG